MQTTLKAAANGLGMLRGTLETDSIISLQYEATGLVVDSGRPMRVLRYRATIGYHDPGMRVDADVSDGGPIRRQIHVVGGRFAWNELEKPGGPAMPAMETYRDRLLQLWMTPHGSMKAARAAGANAKLTRQGDRLLVTFPLAAPLDGATMTVTLNEQHLPERVEARMGTTVIENTYEGYKDWDLSQIFFPSRIVQKRGGQPVLDLTVTSCRCTNPYAVFPVPTNVGAPTGAAN